MRLLGLARWLGIWMAVSLCVDYFRTLPPADIRRAASLNADEDCLLASSGGTKTRGGGATKSLSCLPSRRRAPGSRSPSSGGGSRRR